MYGVFDFLSKNARVAVVTGLVIGAVGAAGAIGWITAPI